MRPVRIFSGIVVLLASTLLIASLLGIFLVVMAPGATTAQFWTVAGIFAAAIVLFIAWAIIDVLLAIHAQLTDLIFRARSAGHLH